MSGRIAVAIVFCVVRRMPVICLGGPQNSLWQVWSGGCLLYACGGHRIHSGRCGQKDACYMPVGAIGFTLADVVRRMPVICLWGLQDSLCQVWSDGCLLYAWRAIEFTLAGVVRQMPVIYLQGALEFTLADVVRRMPVIYLGGLRIHSGRCGQTDACYMPGGALEFTLAGVVRRMSVYMPGGALAFTLAGVVRRMPVIYLGGTQDSLWQVWSDGCLLYTWGALGFTLAGVVRRMSDICLWGTQDSLWQVWSDGCRLYACGGLKIHSGRCGQTDACYMPVGALGFTLSDALQLGFSFKKHFWYCLKC